MKSLINKIQDIDIHIAFYMTHFYKHHLTNEIMKFISMCGDFGMSWLIVILITNMIDQTRTMSIDMLIALIAATLIGQVTIKSLVRRKRPCHTYPEVQLLITTPSDLSFPSGHTGNAACALLLGVLPVICQKLKGKENLLFFIGVIFTLIVAFSRIIVGAHFLTDVTIGMSVTFLIEVIFVYKLWKKDNDSI